MYKVLEAPDQNGSMYTVALVDNPSHVKHVRCSQLKKNVEFESLCPFSAPVQLLETAPIEEPMQDCEWFLLVFEPNPAPRNCQPRLKTPRPRRSG